MLLKENETSINGYMFELEDLYQSLKEFGPIPNVLDLYLAFNGMSYIIDFE